jgi:AraC-like DNA-binding protein
MDPIDEALAAIELLPSGEKFTYSEYARHFGVSRTTLSRRHRDCQASVTTYAREQRLLNPQQEEELVRYIEHLSGDGLPPTRSIIRNFASEIAGKRVGKS